MTRINFILRRFSHQKAISKLKQSPNNFWGKINLAPRDPIISINQLYNQDPNEHKINLSIGTYRTEENKSFIFPCVRQAEKIVYDASEYFDKEYSPMEGYLPFNQEAFKLIFGDQHYDKSNITVQTLAGTGALDLGAAFLGKFFQGRNFDVKAYRYYDHMNRTFDMAGFFEDIEQIPDHSVILFQPCGHNPSAIELTPEQWSMVSQIVRHKNLLPFFDIAYHGLCSGNIGKDTYPIRLFAEHGHVMLVSQSFSKNMGIYGDRVGSLTVLCDSDEEAYRVQSQLKNIIISKYICPPSQGGRVVATILEDSTLRAEWQHQLSAIATRLLSIRQRLRSKLEHACPDHSWQHITEQCGIFWFSGLTSAQVETLINDHSIYLCEDGRVNIAGLNEVNLDAFVSVLRHVLNN